ncbi:MAG TPA: hypothetical protein VE650_17110 [Acetobacteraceae bacterium]|jgi:hypothetical protein|nr:hypothetical protein [Acetobacteraceae bacterium]
MHPVYLLAFAIFALVIGYLVWNRTSVRRNQATGGRTGGLGGPNDPLSGERPSIRSGEEMRQGMDRASAHAARGQRDAGPGRPERVDLQTGEWVR